MRGQKAAQQVAQADELIEGLRAASPGCMPLWFLLGSWQTRTQLSSRPLGCSPRCSEYQGMFRRWWDMGHTLLLEVPENVYELLTKTAEQVGRPREALTAKWLVATINRLAYDPLEKFIGAFSSGVSNWADDHDQYESTDTQTLEVMGLTDEEGVMTLTEILPAVRQLPMLDKIRLLRILAEELDTAEDIFPFEPYKIYLPTPYDMFGAGRTLMDAMAKDGSSN